MNTAILDRVLQRCSTLRCGGVWHALGAVRYGRRLPEDCARLTCGLADEFSEQDLEDSGVVQHDGDGNLQLVPRLRTGSGILIPLHREADSVPFDAVVDSGCLSEGTPAVLAGLEDDWLKPKVKAAGHRVLIAMSIHDLAVLRRLSLPAVLGVGLDRVNREQTDRMATKFGWCQAAGVQPNGAGQRTATGNGRQDDVHAIAGVDVALVGWSPSENDLQEPAQLSATASFLYGLANLRKFDMSNVGIWQPNGADLRGLEVGIRMRDSTAIREVLLESLDHSTYQLAKYVDELDDEPTDFLTARSDFTRALRGGSCGQADPEQVAKAFDGFAAAVDEQVYKPSVAQALSSSGPGARETNLAVAELARELLLRAPKIQCSYGNGTPDDEDERTRSQKKESFDNYLKLTNALLRACREAKR